MSLISKLFSEPVDERALQAAHSWLAYCDAYDTKKSWEEASTIFKRAADMQKWEEIFLAVRKSLGEVLLREQISAKTQKALPGIPDGLYVVIRYKTKFANKNESIETVTVSMEDDAVWRACGYFLK